MTVLSGLHFFIEIPLSQRRIRSPAGVNHHIVSEFGNRELRTLTRDELQKFLEGKADLSFSTTDHLRWDLKQMFDVAQGDGIVAKHPALVLFTPRE
ncbi:MAG TPA: hypothetical protein VJK29_15190, partial [Terriglobales bacterium]|nr:hypothetical protein [Terriglobales bacterium]